MEQKSSGLSSWRSPSTQWDDSVDNLMVEAREFVIDFVDVEPGFIQNAQRQLLATGLKDVRASLLTIEEALADTAKLWELSNKAEREDKYDDISLPAQMGDKWAGGTSSSSSSFSGCTSGGERFGYKISVKDEPLVRKNKPFESIEGLCCLVCGSSGPGVPEYTGLETAVASMFGAAYVRRIREYIDEEFDGVQPVGTCFLQHTGAPQCAFVAQTACYPHNHQPIGYVALSAALRAVALYNHTALRSGHTPISHVVCPGLGTFRGNQFAEVAASQMVAAVCDFRSGRLNALISKGSDGLFYPMS